MLPQMGVFFMSSNIKKLTPAAPQAMPPIAPVKRTMAERLTRNMAIATLLLLTVVGIRTAAVPGGDTLLTSLQKAVQSEWDENLGRLSYVSHSIGESVQVFAGQSGAAELLSPTSVQPVSAFSAAEPYLRYANAGDIYAVCAGEVSAIAHDDAGHYIVRILHNGGQLEGVYYGLIRCDTAEGSEVTAQTCIGRAGQDFAFQLYRAGKAIDCTAQLSPRGK